MLLRPKLQKDCFQRRDFFGLAGHRDFDRLLEAILSSSQHAPRRASRYRRLRLPLSPIRKRVRSGGGLPLCLPQIKPEHIGDAVHPGSDGTECAPLPRRHVISARPCSTISEYACHCSSPCRTAAHGADGVRLTPRYDRGIEPINRSAYAFCQGERGDVGRSRMPIDRTRRINISPYAPSRSRIRYRGICSQPQASVS